MQIDPASLPRLADLAEPPTQLFLRGPRPFEPAVGIVGTRRADPGALRFARRIARRLGEAGVAIISGGATGVDTAAHRGALDADAPTWVVQAAPLEAPYPRSNARLFEEILARGGGWISETPEHQPAKAWRFLARNRLIAALSDVVLVVQAPPRSGALSTARWATEIGRPLFAVPAAPWDPRGAGGAALLAEDAYPCLGAEAIAEALGLCLDAPAQRPLPTIDGPLARVHEALSARPLHQDALARELGLPAAQLTVLLVRLRLLGLAESGPRGWRGTGA